MKIEQYATADFKSMSIHVFIRDAVSEEQLQRLVYKLFSGEIRITKGDIRDATRLYEKEKSPDLLIVDISGQELPLNELSDLANVCAPEVKVIVIGDRDSVGLYRNLLARGVTDYIVKPLPEDLLLHALSSVQGLQQVSQEGFQTGKTVAVWGMSGGVGCTSLISAMGDLLSSQRHRKVMLVDLSLGHGDLALQFGNDLADGLLPLLQNPDRIDRLYLDRISQTLGDRLELLGSKTTSLIDPGDAISAVKDLSREVSSQCHFTLFDIPKTPKQVAMDIVEFCDIRILILDRRLTGIRHTAQLLKTLSHSETAARNVVILNNVRPKFKEDIPTDKIEEALGQKVDFEIPYEGRVFSKSSLQAVPVSRLTSNRTTFLLSEMVDSLTGSSGKNHIQRNFKSFLTGGIRDVWKKRRH